MDYRTGLNKNLINSINILSLTKQYNENKSSEGIINSFDAKGNVIRDHKKELDILVKDEENNILPNIELSYFDSFRLKKTNDDRDFKYVRSVVKFQPNPKYFVQPKRAHLLRNIIASMLSILF